MLASLGYPALGSKLDEQLRLQMLLKVKNSLTTRIAHTSPF
jgi:hypothetical protein